MKGQIELFTPCPVCQERNQVYRRELRTTGTAEVMVPCPFCRERRVIPAEFTQVQIVAAMELLGVRTLDQVHAEQQEALERQM